jgi:hypothetical protein
VPALLAAAIASTASFARDLEQDDRRSERHQQRHHGLPPRHAASVFADDPGKGEQGEDAECRLEIFHCPSSSSAA